ncbi:Ig-like domain-containing protein [Chryseobacterium sp. Leaf394]|uniref:beta strand repeat-containing protein n=1 Tax=Chryseobacterium sp. Leaf394 TaxID=1736361 RepID=UPI0006F9FCED|nr:Ig-like domain-containing protein [Chryseobacterium sp. Leaf394]KQS89152.1 hypothetical protein ASG21_15280 [Chryseobacterium sp. Leaf394]
MNFKFIKKCLAIAATALISVSAIAQAPTTVKLYYTSGNAGRAYDITTLNNGNSTGTLPTENAIFATPATNMSSLAVGFDTSISGGGSLSFFSASTGAGNSIFKNGSDTQSNLPLGVGGLGTNNTPGPYFGITYGQSGRNLYRIFPNPSSTPITFTGDTTFTNGTFVGADICFDYENNAFQLVSSGGNTYLYKMNLSTLVATQFLQVDTSSQAMPGSAVGVAYFNGKIYLATNATTNTVQIRSIDLSNGLLSFVTTYTGPSGGTIGGGNGDLASADYFTPFVLTCGTSTFTGANAATPLNAGVPITKILRVPISNVISSITGRTYTLNVSGPDFQSTSATVNVTSSTTFIDVPVTYTGNGAPGTRQLTIRLNNSTTTCGHTVTIADLDSDGDGITNFYDLDNDNDGIQNYAEGFCQSTPNLIKSQQFTATGSGAAGKPTISFETPITGSGKRMVVLLLSVERDHTPTPYADNWESAIYQAGGIANMPNVSYGGTAMTKQQFSYAFHGATGGSGSTARLSRSQYVYVLPDSSIPAGAQTISLTTFANPINTGDEFVANVLVYDNVVNIENAGYSGFDNTSNYPGSVTVNAPMASTTQPTGTLAQNNLLLAYGGTSNDSGIIISNGWTTVFNTAITNSNGTYSTDTNAFPGSSENDGITNTVASFTGTAGTQSITYTLTNPNAVLGGVLLFRLVSTSGCPTSGTDTDGDGIPNYLDLDSDNDGCLDAIEGGATIASSQLTTAGGTVTVGTGSSAANANLPGPVGQTGANLGIPPLAGNGQGVGTALIANQSPCYIDAKNDINQTPVNIAVAGFLLTNDVSGEGAVTLTSAQFYTSTAGTLANLPVITTAPGTGTPTSIYTSTGTLAGTIRVYSTGEYRFIPATGFTGTVPLNYTAANAVGGSDTASLEIQVIPVTNPTANDAPIALNDTGVTKSGVTLTSNVLGNDSDPNAGNTITVTGATQGSTTIGNAGTPVTVTGINSSGATVTAGTFALTGTGTTAGNYTFVPAAGFVGTVNPITYTISDGNGGTDTAVVNIEVKAATAPPVVFANDDAKATVKGVSASGNMLTNDTSTGTGTLSVTSVTINGTAAAPTGAGILVPGVGTITVSSTGAYTFLPLPTFVGTYVIPYTTCNSATPTPACSTASLYLTSLDLPGYCYKEPITTAVKNLPSKHGITALNRAGSGSTEWPTVRQGAWTVLEAKTKGLVINRTTFVDEDGNPATPPTPPTAAIPAANYVEGMIMYDNGVNCLKVYTGAANGWQCYSTQACPDF